MNASFRDKLLWLHTWSGLTIGLVVVFLGVTGAIFVLCPQLDRLFNADLLVVATCTQPLPLDIFTAKALAVHPGGILEGLEVSTDPRASIAVKFANDDYVYLDPCSGAVLGTRNAYGGFFGTADWLHRFWFMDKSLGKRIAGGSTAIFCVLLIVVGVILWWPRSVKTIKGALKFNPRLPGSARTLSLHKIAGLYTSLVLLVIGLTALPVSFPVLKDAIYDVTGYVKPPKPASKTYPGAQRLPMQALWVQSRALVPAWEWMSLQYAHRPDDAIEIQILEPGAPHNNAKSHLYLDAYTGAPLELSHYASDVGLGRKIYLYSIAVHAGLVWGLPYQLLLLVASLAMPLQAYSGFSPYLRRKLRKPAPTHLTLRVMDKSVDALDVVRFEFADPRGKSLPRFSAGAHLDVKLGDGITRQYSLCNDPGETHRYVICVLRNAESRGGSAWIHDRIQAGDLVEIGVPRNLFPLVTAPHRAVLIAGGIGITPILPMAMTLAARGCNFSLHYCVRSRRHAALLNQILESPFAHRVTVHARDAGERLDVTALLDACDRDTHIYVCGPRSLTEAVITTAQEKGWPASHVHREYFAAEASQAHDNVAFDVRILRTGQVIHVPADKSIVAALADCAIHIPTSCASGVCGTCLTRVVDGDVEHRDAFLTAEQRAKNDQLTSCCSRARGQVLTIDV